VLLAALTLTVVAGGVVVVVGLARDRSPSCGGDEHRVSADDVPGVFTSHEDDARLARLVQAARGWGLGEVVGEVGFDYGQWLSVTALPGDRLGVTTKRDPVLGVVDDRLDARWGLRQARVQHAYDADQDRYLQLELAKDRPQQVSAYRLGDGHRDWCAQVGTTPTRYGDPLATAMLTDGDVVVVADASGPRAVVTRLGSRSGRAQWTRTLAGVDRGDAASALGSVVVVGGRPAFELDDPAVRAPSGPALTALDIASGRPRWTWGAGARVHVLGVAGDDLVLEQQDGPAHRLVALDAAGRASWSVAAPAGTSDVALRAGVVVARTPAALVGLDASTGRVRWRAGYPARPQFFPYGFDLDAQPMLDADHLLLGTTTAVRALDLDTGRMTAYPLPTDGINTTYWPYQLAVSGDLVTVVTNTGAVVLRRG
jgi:outer membrane protein assembly factor BamB